MTNSTPSVAQKVKALRKGKGWSLDKTAQFTGVSKAMLGQIERGESSPTLATLWKLATGFQVSLSGFIQPGGSTMQTYIQKRDNRQSEVLTDGMVADVLFPFDATLGFEKFEIRLTSGSQRLAEAHSQGVMEHITVIEGEIELLIQGKWQHFYKGDCIKFRADEEHGYRNLSNTNAVIHVTISY